VGHRFEHLAAILEHLDGSPRVGVCLDTCHLVASGYDIVSESGYRETFEALDRIVGLERVKIFHGNDSKRPCGSRVDRHEHIGEGCLGLEPFRRLLNDERFDAVPIVIETEKTSRTTKAAVIAEDPLDVKNLATLRSLRRPTGRESAPRSGSSRAGSNGT
jgi:deoxyribonuclease-4